LRRSGAARIADAAAGESFGAQLRSASPGPSPFELAASQQEERWAHHRNLGRQARNEFDQYASPVSNDKFGEE